MLKKRQLKTTLRRSSSKTKFISICVFGLLIYGIALSDAALGATYDAPLEADTHVRQNAPTTSYGSWDAAYAGANGDYEYWALFKWDLSSLQCVTITSVVARFYCSDYLGNLMTPEVYKVTSSWSESSTWNSKPSYGGSDLGHDDLSSSSIDTWYEVDASGLITIVQGWVDTPSDNNGLVIRHDAYGDLRLAEFRTEEYSGGTYKAQLIVTYTSITGPPAPTGVSASDGTICGQVYITWNSSSGADEYRVYRDGSPIGSWQAGTSYNDSPGDTAIHSYQVMAQNSCGQSTLSSGDNGNADSSPSAPTGVSASDGTICGQVYITWNSSSGADEYRVYRDGSPIGSWQAGTSYYDFPGDCSVHTYQVMAQNTCGSSGLSSGNNGSAKCAPVIILHPQSQTVCEGDSVTFNVTATGATGYQWRKNSVDIPGKTNSSYTINPVASGDAGSYDCVVTNACGNPTSDAATLTVKTYPVLPPDIDDDGDVDFEDFARLASHYLYTDCNCPEWCESTDLDWSDTVDLTDLKMLCQYWLEGLW